MWKKLSFVILGSDENLFPTGYKVGLHVVTAQVDRLKTVKRLERI